MNKPRNTTWTWVFMRGPNRKAMQFSLSPKLLILAVAMLALFIASLIVGLVIYNLNMRELNQQYSLLQQQLSDQQQINTVMESELLMINQKSAILLERMETVEELERKLQQYVQLSSDTVSSKMSSTPDTEDEDTKQESRRLSLDAYDNDRFESIGGEYIKVPSPARLSTQKTANETLQRLDTMSFMIERWDEEIPVLLTEVEKVKKQLDSIPTFWPTTSTRITSTFGLRSDPFNYGQAYHNGLDIGGKTGDPIYAAADGTVIEADYDSAKGNYIIIRHSPSLTTRYLHLSKIDVENRQHIKKGDPIGKLGNTGRSTGPHLHFDIMKQETPIDPLPMLNIPSS